LGGRDDGAGVNALVRDRVIAIRAGIVFHEHTDEDGATRVPAPCELGFEASCQHIQQVPGADISCGA
jgi:hypothetical protein